MISRRAATLSGLAAVLAGCNPFPKTYTLRYRLRIVVQIDGKDYEGSSVIEVRWVKRGPLATMDAGPGFSAITFGQAVIVDLGEHGTLFGLLANPFNMNITSFRAGHPEEVLIPLLAPNARTPADIESGAVYAHLKNLQDEYAFPLSGLWPCLIRFRDINDPKSAELVDPGNLALAYGSGAALTRITIGITDAPVTQGIESKFSWWNSIKYSLEPSNGAISARTVSGHLQKLQFKTDGDAW
jgi:hypothetical protein